MHCHGAWWQGQDHASGEGLQGSEARAKEVREKFEQRLQIARGLRLKNSRLSSSN